MQSGEVWKRKYNLYKRGQLLYYINVFAVGILSSWCVLLCVLPRSNGSDKPSHLQNQKHWLCLHFTTGLTKFSLSELKDATQNFSNKNKIGASEYGTVYKVLYSNAWSAIL